MAARPGAAGRNAACAAARGCGVLQFRAERPGAWISFLFGVELGVVSHEPFPAFAAQRASVVWEVGYKQGYTHCLSTLPLEDVHGCEIRFSHHAMKPWLKPSGLFVFTGEASTTRA